MANSFIHKSATIELGVRIGEGTKIWHEAQIRSGAVIGKSCIIGKGVFIDQNVAIGDRVKIQNYACIYYDCNIEDDVFIGPHVVITNDLYPRASTIDRKLQSSHDWKAGKTIIRNGASLGAGVILLPNITIGSFALIGAGAVVLQDIGTQQIVVGNPSRVIGYICLCGSKTIKKKPRLPFVCSLCRKRL